MTTQGAEMTYKLEPGLARITSPVFLLFPSGEKMEFENGEKACETVFDKRWKVTEMRAVNDEIEITLREPDIPDSTFF